MAAAPARRIALPMLEPRSRGAVLTGVALVDAALEWRLQAVLPPSSCGSEALFPTEAAGSSGARISLAPWLGLIAASAAQALHTLRYLRNSLVPPAPRS